MVETTGDFRVAVLVLRVECMEEVGNMVSRLSEGVEKIIWRVLRWLRRRMQAGDVGDECTYVLVFGLRRERKRSEIKGDVLLVKSRTRPSAAALRKFPASQSKLEAPHFISMQLDSSMSFLPGPYLGGPVHYRVHASVRTRNMS